MEQAQENEATVFALELLLPIDMMRQEFLDGYDPFDTTANEKVARLYGVTPAILAFRIGMAFGGKG
jgi:Zn-dependent peptidase ImmA (M78 family)